MTEDYFNGLSIVPLATHHSALSRIAAEEAHPWRGLYETRTPPPVHTHRPPLTTPPPTTYREDAQLIAPPSATSPLLAYGKQNSLDVELHETIRLCDVEAFRKNTAEKARSKANNDQINDLSAGLARLSPSSPSIRPVIYRYVDAIKNSFALVEAIHFELFMPDRPDLRFLGVRTASLPPGTVEGDFIRIADAAPLARPSFAVNLGMTEYPVLWEAARFEKIALSAQAERHGLAYVVGRSGIGCSEAIGEIADRELAVRDSVFAPGGPVGREHSLIRVQMRDMPTAHLYTVEPPRPSPPPTLMSRDDAIAALERMGSYDRAAVYKAFVQVAAPRDDAYVLQTLKGHAGNSRLRRALGAMGTSVMTCVTPANDHPYFAKKEQLFPCLQDDSGIPAEAGHSSSVRAFLVVLVEDFDGGDGNFIGRKGWRSEVLLIDVPLPLSCYDPVLGGSGDFYGGATEGREGGRSMEGKWSRRMRTGGVVVRGINSKESSKRYQRFAGGNKAVSDVLGAVLPPAHRVFLPNPVLPARAAPERRTRAATTCGMWQRWAVCTSSQHAGRVVSAARALSAPEADRLADRLRAFASYGQKGDLEFMDELFRLGSRYRVAASQGTDARDVETKIDESVVLLTQSAQIRDSETISDDKLGPLEACRPLLDCIYGRGGVEETRELGDKKPEPIFFCGMQLKDAQSRAIRMYADEDGPRVFAILSPPGSGKTTIAAAMAATVARSQYPDLGFDVDADYYDAGGEAQLMLSVQNVAVDNIGAALKKMWRGEVIIYNMKSNKKLDPKCPAPFDFFDRMKPEERELWMTGRQPMEKKAGCCYCCCGDPFSENAHEETVRFNTYDECLTTCRREKERKIYPKIILSTVEMVLQKMYTSSKLCEDLRRVRQIVIDEASLLTEAALYAIIRRFPRARIVLIGDDKQLPPFMYDAAILGHELAGRAALSVAMNTGRVPVVQLNEVYRAPPSLVEPYNRLAYGGKLVSRKPEGSLQPLSQIGFVASGRPQLLLIDVDGREERSERSSSLYNEKELQVLVRFLSKCPADWASGTMIICLYKDQKWRVQDMLNRIDRQNQYTVLTVDSAQGKEAPMVILLTTRTQKATDFFCSPERCNVAISRQQQALVILGKKSLLSTTYPWSTVVSNNDFTGVTAD
ncbi:hypothetical protein PRIPAC_79819 [Pristionchus pacificus]|nr:hypothetical protein PRIPAC_79819 [Pristionchus pacificus]